MKSYVIIFLIMIIQGCDIIDNRWVIVNDRKNAIFYFISDSNINNAYSYFSNAKGENEHFVNIDSPKHIGILGDIRRRINEDSTRGGTYLYVIDSNNIGKDSLILKNKKLVTRYMVTVKDMEEKKWTMHVN